MTEQSVSLRSIIFDLVIFSSIIPILVGIHFLLPDYIHDAMVFDHSEFAIYTLWTSAYVHLNNGHLINNVLGYFMAMTMTWFVFFYQYRQWVLRRVFLIYLAVFPILISLSSYGVYQFWLGAEDAVTRGFSGIVAAIFGLLFVSILNTTNDRMGWRGAYGVTGTVMFVILGHMLIRAGAGTPRNIALCSAGALLTLSIGIPLDIVRNPKSILGLSPLDRLEVLLVAGGSIILMYALPRMFPLDWIREDEIINIFGHFAGIVLGIISGIILIWWLRSAPQSRAQWPESSMQ